MQNKDNMIISVKDKNLMSLKDYVEKVSSSMEYPLISIAIPVYNTAKFLSKCIESAIAQRYPNLEIVILNNGSTDNSQDIISEFASRDIRIRSFLIPHVPTVKESKDNCYARTTGDWVITLDSDDALGPDYVQKMWDAHLKTGADMIISQRVSVDEDGKEFDYLPLDKFDFNTCYTGLEALRRTIVKWEMSINGALVHKSNLFNIMLENPKCRVFSDEHDSRVLLKCSKNVGFSLARYYYTFNPNSVGKKNNWNRHRFRLNTRLGLLELCEREYGYNSYEYQNAVTQSIGVALIAARHYLVNRQFYTKENIEEIKVMIKAIIDNTRIVKLTARNSINFTAKMLLKFISCMI